MSSKMQLLICLLLFSKASQAQNPPYINSLEQVQGQLPGVQITPNRSEIDAPPKVIIRGYNTWNNNQPLYVIDGMQTDDATLFNSLNPYDIKSVTVLKDASAAVYGARGSNGVILVRTKEAAYIKKNSRKRKKKKRKKKSKKLLNKEIISLHHQGGALP